MASSPGETGLYRSTIFIALILLSIPTARSYATELRLPYLTALEKEEYVVSSERIGEARESRASLWGIAVGYHRACNDKYVLMLVSAGVNLEGSETKNRDWLSVATISARSIERLILKLGCPDFKKKILPGLLKTVDTLQ